MTKPCSMENFNWPVFHIKLQDSSEKGSQKSSKETIEKLTLRKNVFLAHVHTTIDEVIKILYNIKAANKSMQKCKKALAYFNVSKLTLPKNHSVLVELIKTPGMKFIHNTISLQNSVLELIWNLQ